jgi:16S rRNA processing protein RimM
MPRQNKLQEYSQHFGSTASGEPTFLAVGRLLRPHGLTGELLMDIYTDFPERLKMGSQVYVGEDHRPTIIRSRRGANNGFLIGFKNITDSESAGELRNQIVYVMTKDIPPLPDGDYYHHQILGLKVITEDGNELGIISSILDTGSNDVYVIQPGVGKEILIPNISAVVKEINLEKGEMHIHLMEGLLPV